MSTHASLAANEATQFPYTESRHEAASLSVTIAIARVICICGIVYVHAWTGLDVNELRAQGGSWHSVLYWTLIELVGRSSVPLLSIISGWLVMASVTKRSYGQFVRQKAKSLLLPMILWNVITVALIAAFTHFGQLKAPQPEFGMALVREIFHLQGPGEVNVQNAFLRDVFVCMLAAPVLVRLPSVAIAVILAGTLAWSIEGWQLYILLRPQIFLFFLVGMLAFRFKLDRFVERLPILPVTMTFAAAGLIKCWVSVAGQQYLQTHPEAVAVLDNGLRIVAAVFFWRLAQWVANSNLADAFRRFDPYTFLLFCTHVMLIWLLAPVIGPLFGRFGETGYPVFLLLQPLLALGGAVLIGQALLWISPPVARIMSGGRLAMQKRGG